jgi:hypothetical protein
MRRQIFISYRRDDEPGMATALYFQLEQKFTGERIFMDVEGDIRPGKDFVRIINQQVAECDVMLVMVGRGWLSAASDEGERRLDNPEDFIRLEIESAIQLDKLVIPVLINKTDMPRASELPATLKPFARFQAVRLTQERVRADMSGIANHIAQALTDIERERAAKESRSWEEIKDTTDPALVRNHLQRFPDGSTAESAQTKLAVLERDSRAAAQWRAISDTNQPEIIEQFIRDFPGSAFTAQAKGRLDEIHRAREHDAWDAARGEFHPAPLLRFLRAYPQGIYAEEALRRLQALPALVEDDAWTLVQDTTEPIVLRGFLAALPNSRHAKAVAIRLRNAPKAGSRQAATVGAPQSAPASATQPPPLAVAAVAVPVEAAAAEVSALPQAAGSGTAAPASGPDLPIVYRILIAFCAVVAAVCTITIIGNMSPPYPVNNLSPVTVPIFVGAASVLWLALLLHFSRWRRYEGKPDSPERFKLQAAGALVILGWMLITEVLGELNYKYITTSGSTHYYVYNVNQGTSLAYIVGAGLLGAVAIMAIRSDKKGLRVAFSAMTLAIGLIAVFVGLGTGSLSGGSATNYWVSAELNLYGGLALMLFAITTLFSRFPSLQSRASATR